MPASGFRLRERGLQRRVDRRVASLIPHAQTRMFATFVREQSCEARPPTVLAVVASSD